MKDELVQDCNQILRLILDKEKSVNKTIQETSLSKKRGRDAKKLEKNQLKNINNIIKEIGLPKKRGYDAKDFLEKNHFIKGTSDPKHKQRMILSLTEIGQYFAKLIINFEKFEKFLNNFNDKVEKFNGYGHLEESVRINQMHFEQWSIYDIENYSLQIEYVNNLKIEFFNIMPNVIENIYAILLLKFHLNPEVKEYINKFVSEKIAYYLQKKFDKTLLSKIYERDDIYQIKIQEKTEGIYEMSGESLFDTIIFENIRFLIHHKLISKEIKDLTYSIFDLMCFPKEYIQQKINDGKELVKSNEHEIEDNGNIQLVYSFYDSLSSRD